MLEEGQIVKIKDQRYLVVFVEYSGTYSNPWVKNLELKGIKDD